MRLPEIFVRLILLGAGWGKIVDTSAAWNAGFIIQCSLEVEKKFGIGNIQFMLYSNQNNRMNDIHNCSKNMFKWFHLKMLYAMLMVTH